MLYCQDGEGGTIADQALSSFAHFPVSAPAHHIYGGPESSLSSHSDATGFWWTQDTKKNYIKSLSYSIVSHDSNSSPKTFSKSWHWEEETWAIRVPASPILSKLTMGCSAAGLLWIRILPSATEQRPSLLNTNITIHHLVVHLAPPHLTQCITKCSRWRQSKSEGKHWKKENCENSFIIHQQNSIF